MKRDKIKFAKKRYRFLPSIIVFLISTIVSYHIVLNYNTLYEDKQYADMITCSESLSTQVYNAIMRTFSKGSPLSEIVSARGEAAFRDANQMEALLEGTAAKGFLYAPLGKITAAYPEDEMSAYIGLDLSDSFPEPIRKETLYSINEPIIIGPYTVPQSDKQAMAIINAFYTTGPRGRQYAGHTVVVVDYPDIFEGINFSELEKKNILCRVWRYNEYSSKIQTLLETKDPFPDKITRNNTTFKKVYFTTGVNYSLVPKYTFYQSASFIQLAIVLAVVILILTIGSYVITKGYGYSQDLKFYKVQSKLVKVQEHTIISLSSLVENRDSDTGEHIRRTSDYVYMIANKAREAGIYSDILTDEYIEMLKNAAPMHDIGKIVIPDAVLKKPGKLSPEEFEQIKRHTTEGGKIVQDILGPVQTPEFVTITQQIAESHHEKWNGKGYPKGLAGNDIPLSARIMSLADVFDALTTPRCYKEPFPFEKAIDIIKEDCGIAFDPQLTEIFLANQDRLREIMAQYISQ